jgi:serine/threonine protein kinase/tetratricopeptide (TPR) repeat protein
MQDLIGRTVGHYRIVEHLGGGGMGVVYKAEDTKLGRTVALKFLPPEWSRDPDARERFFREARAASALEDSRICTIFDIDETEDGQLFIAMAYYDGETLKKRLERGRLPLDEAVGVAVQIAKGLKRAHAAGIIHRDIKPANLMLTADGEVKIVDFGLAKLAGEHGLTKTGATVGTPHYMSPEQARGAEVYPATDVWSLGVVLYEMSTGRRPFIGATGDAVVHSILHERPERASDLRTGMPPMLERIIHNALEKDPEKRFGSVQEMLSDLRALQTSSVERGLRTEAMKAPVGKHRRVVAVLGLVFLAVFVIAMTWVLSQQAKSSGLHVSEDLPRIVVLPFENLGPPVDEYFADGVTEEITNRLASVSGLQVISRTSAMYYKGRKIPLRQIGDELEVEYALEGTIRWDRAGKGPERVRITPQLIRVDDDSHIWGDRYDRVMDEIFTVQTDIAQQVIDQLQANLLETERRVVEARPTGNMEAYAAYLRGLRLQRLFEGPQEAIAGVEALQRAVELDPLFARAFALLAESHAKVFHLRVDYTDERLALAKTAVDRAMALHPGLPEGHRALGLYYYCGFHDFDRARKEYALALDGIPNDEETLIGLFAVARRQGRWDEAIERHEKLLRNNPRDYALWLAGSHTYRYMRQYNKAAVAADKFVELAPDRFEGFYFGALNYLRWEGTTHNARRMLVAAPVTKDHYQPFLAFLLDFYDRRPDRALVVLETKAPDVLITQDFILPKRLLECMCYAEMGDSRSAEAKCASAIEWLEQEVLVRPKDFRLYDALGYACSLTERRDEAIEYGERMVQLIPTSKDAIIGPSCELRLARILARAGELERAIEILDGLLAIPGEVSVPILRLDPVWDPLRDHPRFQALLEEYGEE